ncbi:hypothetical protein O181_066607 [Austropuccinia psidii MF-1]|uniref:Uncharacterized protein n=1 Tax=Austropuccinia psidii MF-1 TaxID=1389203 RepID=A0A9Q3EZC9_9BASI|nr:hypothetical protein [Austropuccinia psidii MF-1]
MNNWSILVLYGLWATPSFTGPLWPQANSLVLGLGVHLDFQWPLVPLATTRALGPTPFIMGILGHLDHLWPQQSIGPLGPFWPKSNEAKRGQGGQLPTFKARWDPNHKWAHLS